MFIFRLVIESKLSSKSKYHRELEIQPFQYKFVEKETAPYIKHMRDKGYKKRNISLVSSREYSENLINKMGTSWSNETKIVGIDPVGNLYKSSNRIAVLRICKCHKCGHLFSGVRVSKADDGIIESSDGSKESGPIKTNKPAGEHSLVLQKAILDATGKKQKNSKKISGVFWCRLSSFWWSR